MKKLKQLINNVYRICMVNPMGRKHYASYKVKAGRDTGPKPDDIIRQIIQLDQLSFKSDLQIQENLRQRVRNSGQHTAPAKNSLLEAFLPLFSARHIEIKMAVVSLALFMLVGLGPKNSPASDRKMHLFFLADTLGDSSSLHNPAAQDTAFRVQYK